MNRNLLLAVSASLGVLFFAGCTSLNTTSTSPGVIVATPVAYPCGGDGMITVKWATAQASLEGKAEWWITPAHHLISSSVVFVPATYTVNFGALAGYTAPAPKSVPIVANKKTVVTVTYGQP